MTSRLSGVLVLNKPAGISSRQALDRVTRLMPQVKMGHAGTLDPMATGVLVVCVGKATRLIRYVQRMMKEYQATLRLGQRSGTHDLEGTVEEVSIPGPISQESFDSCLVKFRGEIQQVPPQHSAVHVDGRRAYELARAGQVVDLAPRPVLIHRLECTRFEFPDADLEIRCSSGTYIRSLVRDIGETLGCGAVMTKLVRSAIGPFRLDDAAKIDELTREKAIDSLRPLLEAVTNLPRIVLAKEQFEYLHHGRLIDGSTLNQKVPRTCDCALVDSSGALLAIAAADPTGRTLHPHTVLLHD